MIKTITPLFALLLLVAMQTCNADLKSYVNTPDSSYSWKLKGSSLEANGTRIYELEMHSQTWQGILWTHRVLLFVPPHIAYPGDCSLYITGGNGGSQEMTIGNLLSNRTESAFAILFNIPNQPLFDGRSEDSLIAFTFEKYLDGGDASWPLLFPMVKSALRCMDALQAFTRQQGANPLRKFVVMGVSKRGWTTWLTACSGDKRVIGIIPMSIDNLNLKAQMEHQIQVWGEYSNEIDDYTKLGIQEKLTTPRGEELAKMVDPWTYRKSLTLPKLIVRGSNDAYWTQDALNLYWDGLQNPKWALILPNSGHGLEDRSLLSKSIIAFVRSLFADKMPEQPGWRYVPNENGEKLIIHAPSAKDGLLWSASSDTQDFRKSKWSSVPLQKTGDGFEAEIKRPDNGYAVVYAQINLETDGGVMPVTTEVSIIGAK